MAITSTATPAIGMSYTLSNVQGGATTTENTTIGNTATSLQFPHGSGSGNVNMGTSGLSCSEVNSSLSNH